jgi:replication factor A1
MNYYEIIERLVKSTGIEKKVLEGKVEDKVKELDKLVSKDGAAHIIANELGVSLIDADASQDFVNINNLVGGLRNVIVLGRVVDIYPVNTYEKDGKELQVGALSLSDGTGFVRVVFWNDNINVFNNIKEGDIIKVINAYVKENKFGKLELHISFRTKVRINPDDVDPKSLPTPSQTQRKSERVDLVELKRDTFVRVMGVIVNVFKSNCFFHVCPECKKSVKADEGIFMCEAHGKVTPDKKMRVSFVLDDGTSNVRVTSFGRDAEEVIGLSTKEAVELADAHEDVTYPIEHTLNNVVGNEVLIYGRAQFNDFSNSVEIITNKVINNINYNNELSILANEVQYGDKD